MTTRPDMRAFAAGFFTHFGAALLPDSQPDELVVDLPPGLAQHFGKERLYLVFPTDAENYRELSPHEDLLVYGSRHFDLMLKLLAQQGQTAHLAYPRQISVQVDGSLRPLLIRPRPGVLARQIDADTSWYHVFNYRVVYTSDEKEEVFVTTVLDEQGQPAPSLAEWLPTVAPLPQPPADPPPLTDEAMRQRLEQATAITRQNVADRLIELQQTVRARLERVLLRLTGYYQRRSDDIPPDAPNQEQLREELAQDLNRKIADELERHQLRVTVTPVSYALARISTAAYQLTLTTIAPAPDAAPCLPYPHPAPPDNLPPELSWGHYRWDWLSQPDFTVYVGHHPWRGIALLVQDYSGKLLHWERVGWVDWLTGRAATG